MGNVRMIYVPAIYVACLWRKDITLVGTLLVMMSAVLPAMMVIES